MHCLFTSGAATVSHLFISAPVLSCSSGFGVGMGQTGVSSREETRMNGAPEDCDAARDDGMNDFVGSRGMFSALR